ncbi:T9SS type A sorting domain-containing protein [Flavobacterium sp. 3HN19-14]|uniref:T9SS type A sorting domain-containing protein n=1 Tax=Flavobacterium sp. 3HN19-14 TaxID=3448133 RepID=UPI003EDEC732
MGAFAGEDQGEYVFKIATDTENNVIAPGLYVSAAVHFGDHTINQGAGVYDIFLAKLGTGVLGVSQVPQSNSFIIYPNPMGSETNIYLDEPSVSSATVIITDALGRKIKTYDFKGQLLTIKRDNLEAGNYFIKVIDDKGNVEIKKLLVQ